MIPPKMLDDVIQTLRNNPSLCITFAADVYRTDGAIMLSRDGKQWYLHRYLAHVLGWPMAAYMKPGGCGTFGCMNPRHRILATHPGHGSRLVCPNGHPYTPRTTIPGRGKLRCAICRDARNARRRKGVRRRGYCAKGHRLTNDNVYRWHDAKGREHRRCRRCTIDRMRASRHPA